MWDLIHNELKIFIDPLFFSDRSIETISKQVALINTLKDYLIKTDPALCGVTFFFPRYIEKNLGLKRSFLPNDKVTFIDIPPTDIIEIIKMPEIDGVDTLKAMIKMHNEYVSLAIQKKCAFLLTKYEYHQEIKINLKQNYGLEIVNLDELHIAIEQFLQGFYNYFKFRMPIYGIKAPDIAHAMTEEFFQKVLIPFESEIQKANPSPEAKERIRSFVHNRYVDILTTIDQIGFFRLEQRISNIENNNLDNKKPHLHGHIRYYLNYYLLLLWGALDHFSWIINDIFEFGYNPDKRKDQMQVGLNNRKEEFLLKIKGVDEELYNYIISNDFQEWLGFFAQLRHQNAHREMLSASPLLITTDESKISDEEIDKIIYKDRQPLEEESANAIRNVMGEEVLKQMENNQRMNDRYDYRLSKLKKGLDHFAMVKKGEEHFMLDPVGRIPTDLKNLKDLVEKASKSYNKFRDSKK